MYEFQQPLLICAGCAHRVLHAIIGLRSLADSVRLWCYRCRLRVDLRQVWTGHSIHYNATRSASTRVPRSTIPSRSSGHGGQGPGGDFERYEASTKLLRIPTRPNLPLFLLGVPQSPGLRPFEGVGILVRFSFVAAREMACQFCAKKERSTERGCPMIKFIH